MVARKASRSRVVTFPPGGIHQLLFRWDYFGDGFGNGPEGVRKMRAAWKDPEIRAKVWAEFEARRAQMNELNRPRPWAAVQWGD